MLNICVCFYVSVCIRDTSACVYLKMLPYLSGCLFTYT